MQTLAVVIITLNEARNIERCILSLSDLADEIVVLDAFSTDETAEICRKHGVSFHQRNWEGYAASKNYANSLTTCDYIFSLDADEALSTELLAEIKSEKKKGFSGVYSVNRLTNYMGKWIYHSGWFPDIKTRIFPKKGSFWSGEYVHEELMTPSNATTTSFKNILAHYSYYSFEDHRARADKYSYLTAQKFYAAGKKASILKPYLSAIGRFVAMYLLKRGFLDGKMGFKIAQISALSNIVKYKALRQLHRDGKS